MVPLSLRCSARSARRAPPAQPPKAASGAARSPRCRMPAQTGPVLRETFAPILYAMRYSELEQAIEMHNAVGAGLASSIFTGDRSEERHVGKSVDLGGRRIIK